jgi:mono/diheme cytochrome c family protein
VRQELRRAGTRGALLGLLLSAGVAPALPLPQETTWEAPPEANDVQNPLKTDGHTVERGMRLYRQYCLPCHGEAGVGDGAMAKKLGYKPANLTFERVLVQTDGALFWKVTKGKVPMPEFGKQLSARERWDIVSYVRTFSKGRPQP